MPEAAREPRPTQRAPVLVVDDDGDIRLALEMLLAYDGFEVWTAKDGEEAYSRICREREAGREPALVLTDLKMPRLDGLELLDRLRALPTPPPPPPVVLISGHGDVPLAVEAIKRGAANFLEKPIDENRVRVTIRAALREQRLALENSGLRARLASRWELIGGSAAMRKLEGQIRQVADSDAAVLITGENGSGKEVVARNLHYLGARASGPFVPVNCAAIPGDLIESELFGHEKGSFTGAHDRRTGHFEAADGGTLFLDEVGDMPLPAQAKVLRALESHEIIRVGDSRPIPVDIRVLAATNADLALAVEEKRFRTDLFYRLNVVPLRVPPLRERPEDVAPLARHFLAVIAERSGRNPRTIEEDALRLLAEQSWPGNVRQLRNALEGASVFGDGETITRADIEEVLASGPSLSPTPRAASVGDVDPFALQTFEQFKELSEALFFRHKLAQYQGNIKKTAEELGMQRSHLYKKLDRYRLR